MRLERCVIGTGHLPSTRSSEVVFTVANFRQILFVFVYKTRNRKLQSHKMHALVMIIGGAQSVSLTSPAIGTVGEFNLLSGFTSVDCCQGVGCNFSSNEDKDVSHYVIRGLCQMRTKAAACMALGTIGFLINILPRLS